MCDSDEYTSVFSRAFIVQRVGFIIFRLTLNNTPGVFIRVLRIVSGFIQTQKVYVAIQWIAYNVTNSFSSSYISTTPFTIF